MFTAERMRGGKCCERVAELREYSGEQRNLVCGASLGNGGCERCDGCGKLAWAHTDHPVASLCAAGENG